MQFSFTRLAQIATTTLAAIGLATPAAAMLMPLPADGRPPMPGMTQGPGGQPGMIHTEVFLDGTTLEVQRVGGMGFDPNADALLPVVMRDGSGFDAPFDVLNGKAFNAQYGWLPSNQPGNQLQNLPLDRVLAVELTELDANNPGPLETYAGGNGVQLRPRDANQNLLPTQHTMTPILSQVGDVWLWDDFVMQHNWYAANQLGTYAATYEVFVSDRDGNRDTQYGSDSVTLNFTVIPEPAALSTFGLAGLTLLRRRGH